MPWEKPIFCGEVKLHLLELMITSKIAKETGCLELSVGIETVDDNAMKYINQTWQSEKIIAKFIENIKKVGIKIKICLIFVNPRTKNIVEKTVKFIEKYKPDFIRISGFCPMPGVSNL